MKTECSNLCKVMLITNIPTPYRIPLFNEISRLLREKGAKLKIVFGALTYSRRKWRVDLSSCEFDYKILASKFIKLSNQERVIFTYPSIIRLIYANKPHIIVANGFSFATTKIWMLSWLQKLNYIIWSGAIELNQSKDSRIRRFHRRLMIKRAKGFIAYGKESEKYLCSLGAQSKKIEIGINTVDTSFFAENVKRYRSKFQRGFNQKQLLFVGSLVKRKGVDLLFRCIGMLLKYRRDFLLKIVGDGPERENLMNLSNKLMISNFISFEGFAQKEELIKYYAEADCFIFPTRFDIWGLVLVEAMAAGLPCIASLNAGATYDLIIDGVTGFSADFNKPYEVINKINLLLEDKLTAKRIGEEASHFIAEKASLTKSAQGFIRAIEKAWSN